MLFKHIIVVLLFFWLSLSLGLAASNSRVHVSLTHRNNLQMDTVIKGSQKENPKSVKENSPPKGNQEAVKEVVLKVVPKARNQQVPRSVTNIQGVEPKVKVNTKVQTKVNPRIKTKINPKIKTKINIKL